MWQISLYNADYYEMKIGTINTLKNLKKYNPDDSIITCICV